MKRSLPPVLTVVAGIAATGFGLVALSQGASAHTPSISASCSGVVLEASNYDAALPNEWSVTIDGTSTSGTFGGSLSQSFPVPQDRAFTWSAQITDPTGQYAQSDSGSIGPCVTPPPTTPPTTPPPTTPPTTPPPTTPPTTPPPTTPPTTPPTPPTTPPTNPPTNPPTPPTNPPTNPPPAPPTAVDPTDGSNPPETDTPTPEQPTTVASDGGTRGPDGDGGDDGVPPAGDNGGGPGVTLPDTGATEALSFTPDQGMVSSPVARTSLLAGLLLLVLGSWQLWRRERA